MQSKIIRGFRLSPQQKRLWFFQRHSQAYRAQCAVLLEGSLNIEALKEALRRVVVKYEILRTAYYLQSPDGPPLQTISDAKAPELSYLNSTEMGQAEQERIIEDLFREHGQGRFDGENGLPLRASLVVLSVNKHVLLVSLPALCADAQTLVNLTREIGNNYAGALSGEACLTEAMQYADLAEWLNELLETDDYDARHGRSYWEKIDFSVSDASTLPFENKLAGRRFEPSLFRFQVDPDTAIDIKSIARESNTSVETVLLACSQALLQRLTRQTDILIGTLFDGRKQEELQDALGLFAKRLPLRCHYEQSVPFNTILSDLYARINESRDWGEYFSWDRVTGLNQKQEASFFSNCFEYHKWPSNRDYAGVCFSVYRQYACIDPFKVKLSFVETGDRLSAEFFYDSNLFRGEDIDRLAEQYQALLKSIAANPNAPVDKLSILGERERRRMLIEFNSTKVECPNDKRIHELFEEQAARTPERVAVVYESERLTYHELNRRSGRLARHLRASGVGPEIMVGICTERTLDTIVGALAILKAGGAYVPMDPSFPRERLAFMIEDSRARIVLTQTRIAGRLPIHGDRTILLDAILESDTCEDDTNITERASAANPAYVIYTSGSTGKPKGVIIEHGQIVNYVRGVTERLGLSPTAAYAMVQPITVDSSKTVLFSSLCRGGSLHVLSEETSADPNALGEYFSCNAIDCLKIAPSHLAALLTSSRPTEVMPRQWLVIGGEASRLDWVERLHSTATGCKIFNHYGPTEATVGMLTYHVEEGAHNPYSLNTPIGRPLPNTQAYLLDDHLQHVPIGVIGELYIGGRCLARGYLNRSDLTADKFIPNPFSDEVGARLYKTGDLTRYLRDGDIEFMGRLDHQVKIRGFRIELSEIEAALAQHPAVREVVVTDWEEAPNKKRLIAYLVLKQKPVPSFSEFERFLKERLPEYMTPSAFVPLDSMPRTPHGKLDRKALPPPSGAQIVQQRNYVAPRTPAEQILAAIWSKLLGADQVGIYDNFFELGGDSIISIQVISRANQAGLRLTPKQIFQYQTVAELAAVAVAAPGVEGEREIVTGYAPLTPIQHRFFESIITAPHHYNHALLLELKQSLDPILLDQAIAHLLKHHDALRLRFHNTEQGWEQVNAPAEPANVFSVTDLSDLEPEQQPPAIERVGSAIQQSLNLSSGPLLRAAMIELGAGRTGRLLLVIHHLAVDGVSWRILLEDLATSYDQLSAGGPVKLPAKTTSYQRWAEAYMEYAGSGQAEADLSYWQKIAGQTVKPLPLDYEVDVEAKNTVESADTVRVGLSRERTRQLLQEAGRAYRMRIDELLATALWEALTGWTGEEVVKVEMEWHGRQALSAQEDVTRTVGWFTAIYPVALKAESSSGAGAKLKAIKEQVRAGSRRAMSYGALRYLSGDERVKESLRGGGQAELIFNYLGQTDEALEEKRFAAASESVGDNRSGRGERRRLLEVNAIVAGGRLEMYWNYSRTLHRRETIERVARGCVKSLEELIEHCLGEDAVGYTPSDFPLSKLSQEELDRVLEGRQDVEDVYVLTPMQQGMLFHTLYSSETAVYRNQLAVRLIGELNEEAFIRAWDELVGRHEVMRSGFEWEGVGEPVQVISRRSEVTIEREDWRSAGRLEQGEKLEEFLDRDRVRGFDLRRAPFMRLTLIRVGEQEYNFVWNRHHLMMDGWCMQVVLKEVFTLYEANCKGERAELAPARKYRDYIEWLQKQDLNQAQAFWKRTLSGFSAPTRIGLGRPANRLADVLDHARKQISIDRQRTRLLQDLCRQQQLTMNTLVQGAWGILLSRYSGQPDVVFGATVSGRPAELEGVERMVGLFINTLPARVKLQGEEEVGQWLKQLQAEQAEMRQYEYSPLVEVQKCSEMPGGEALFESILVFENYPTEPIAQDWKGGLQIQELRYSEQTNYPLTIDAAVLGGFLSLQITYDQQQFDATMVSRMLGHIQSLLQAMADGPKRPTSCLSILTEEEQYQSLVQWNATQAPPMSDQRMHELFTEQAVCNPDRIALILGDERLTYGELNNKTNQLANYLRGLGVGPEARVAVYLERDLKLIIALLGVFKAGGVYIPLDPAYPYERIAYMLEDALPSVILTQIWREAALPPTSARIIYWDSEWANIGRQNDSRLPPSAHPENLAYIIYTSGSTGRPKGAMIEHRGMLNHLQVKIRDLALCPDDVVAQNAPASFDISIWQMLACLLVGGAVRVISVEVAADPRLLLEEVDYSGVTVLETVPALLALMAQQEMNEGAKLSALRWMISTAEALPAEICRQWIESYPGIPLLNAYGPTECSDDVTHYRVNEAKDWNYAPLGFPLLNTQLYVLDWVGQPAPVGVAGELCVGGIGVGRGYLNQSALTAEKFVPHSWNGGQASRLYRTGDRVRRLSEGSLEFLERIDHQIKIRGRRIELGEIEARLAEYDGVREAVVIAREDTIGDPRLMAYIVRRSEGVEAENQEDWKTVSGWQSVFEQVYEQKEAGLKDELINARVWISSYTGEPFGEGEILECVENTARRILDLKPKRVLEIGCGTGLILSRVAPQCEEYYGTDISGEALRQLQQYVERANLEDRVQLRRQAADDLVGVPREHFDVVVLNEVVQYFPSLEYLLKVLDGVRGALAKGGKIYLGDVRNLDLLETFHSSVELYRAGGEMRVEELRRRILRSVKTEKELVLAPGLFIAMEQESGWIKEAVIELKEGRYRNEFTKFRYDVALHTARRRKGFEDVRRQDWEVAGWSVERLRSELSEGRQELAFTRVPNASLARDLAGRDWLALATDDNQVSNALVHLTEMENGGKGVEPEEMRSIAREFGYEVRVCWPSSGIPGSYEVLLWRDKCQSAVEELVEEEAGKGITLSRQGPRWSRYSNRPSADLGGGGIAGKLREYLQERLPSYMVPTAYIELEKLPLTPNGKVDRKALLSLEIAEQGATFSAVPPTPTQGILIGIWGEVLNLERVGLHDNFFDLGGHSLLATQVISRLHRIFKIELPLRKLFEAPTVAGLARQIEQALLNGGPTTLPPIVRVSRDENFLLPLSYAQQRLFFLDQLYPDSNLYNIPLAVRMRGNLNIRAFEQTLSEVARRHEALRTRFVMEADMPVQKVEKPSKMKLPVLDLSGLGEPEREAEAVRIAEEEARRGFDLSIGPMFRAGLLRLGGDEHIALFTMHHIISDGWSLDVLIREVTILYETYTTGGSSPLDELPIQYADYAVWQQQRFQGWRLDKQVEYWKGQIGDKTTVMRLPTDRPRSSQQTNRGARRSIQIGEELTQALKRMSRREGVTLYMLLLAAFEALLHLYTEQEEVIVGSPVSGRVQVETEQLIGFFINTLAMKASFAGNPTFRELLRQARETVLNAHAHQDLPFERLVEIIQPERSLSHTPIVQVWFLLINATTSEYKLPDLELSLLPTEPGTVKLDLGLTIVENEKTLTAAFDYKTDLFDAHTISEMLGHLRAMLEAVTEHPDWRVLDLPLITKDREGSLDPKSDLPEPEDLAAIFTF